MYLPLKYFHDRDNCKSILLLKTSRNSAKTRSAGNLVYLARSQFNREDVALVGYLQDLRPGEAVDSQSLLVNQ